MNVPKLPARALALACTRVTGVHSFLAAKMLADGYNSEIIAVAFFSFLTLQVQEPLLGELPK